MEYTQLVAYLKNIVQLETQYQTADQAWQICYQKAAGMGRPQLLAEPQKPKEEGGALQFGIFMGVSGMAACFVLWLILEALNGYSGKSWFWGILMLLSTFLKPIPVIAGVLWLGYCVVTGWNSEMEMRERNKKAMASYESSLRWYETQMVQDAARVKADLAVLPDLNRDVQLLLKRKKNAKELLDRFYGLNIVKHKYRNLLCVATFLEYLENERCYSLTGHEGCYNLFEEELQRGIIIAQLTNISQQLGQIRRNQERAADALEEIQRTTHHLSEGIQGLNGRIDVTLENQRVQTYYAEQIAKDQRMLRDYVMMRDWQRSNSACNV